MIDLREFLVNFFAEDVRKPSGKWRNREEEKPKRKNSSFPAYRPWHRPGRGSGQE
jgi:hypothetical protein